MSTGPPAPGARPVLVVGATGKTGRAVAAALRERGVGVRAAVRRGREADAPLGSAPVAVDLATGQGLQEALEGVRAAYHLAPNMHPDEVGMAERFATAAVATGLPRAVFHSVLHPDDARMPHHLRKAAAETLLAGLLRERLTVLRPAAYHQNLLPQVRSGVLAVPYSLDAPFTNVDLEDVAEVAAAALLGEHAGRTVELAGPEVLSTAALARSAAAALGRPVVARRLTVEEWVDGPGSALAPTVSADLVAMFEAYDADGLVGDPGRLPLLLGRPAVTWAERVLRSASTRADG